MGIVLYPLPPTGSLHVSLRIADYAPQNNRPQDIQDAKAYEERRISDRGNQRADQERKNKHPAISKCPGHSCNSRDLILPEKVG